MISSKRKKQKIEELMKIEIGQLRQSLNESDDLARDFRADAEVNQEIIHAIQEILHYCRLRNELPTIEAIELAIEGKSFVGCLVAL